MKCTLESQCKGLLLGLDIRDSLASALPATGAAMTRLISTTRKGRGEFAADAAEFDDVVADCGTLDTLTGHPLLSLSQVCTD